MQLTAVLFSAFALSSPMLVAAAPAADATPFEASVSGVPALEVRGSSCKTFVLYCGSTLKNGRGWTNGGDHPGGAARLVERGQVPHAGPNRQEPLQVRRAGQIAGLGQRPEGVWHLRERGKKQRLLRLDEVGLRADTNRLREFVPIYYPDSNGYPQLVIGHSCDANQTNAIYQAHYDAEEMAYVALGGHNGDDGRNITINWDSTAVVDYFGSPSENFAYSEHILRTLALASGVDTGWRNGGDDLANRAILVACNDPMDRCKSVSTAYTYNGLGQDAP
ncbi:hypothetical protein PG995_012670 [Apiospora arundinis]